jgi:large subunit ribosomal protein L22
MIQEAKQEVRAKIKYLRLSPRKTRLLADSLKGLSLNEAEGQLLLTARRAGGPLLKLLRSAAANARHNAKLDTARLYIKDIRVDGGPKFRRYMPRARGSASPIDRRTSHVTLVLAVSEKTSEPKFTFIAKSKSKSKLRELKDKEAKTAKTETQEKSKITRSQPTTQTKPTTQPTFFQRIFRRKAI